MVLACVLAPLVAAGAGCVDLEQQNRWASWSTLRLRVKSAPLIRGQIELRLSHGPAGRRLETSTTARFLGAKIAESETTTVLDPTTGYTLEYRSYSKKKGRRYLFDDKGYAVEKLLPDAKNESGDGWKLKYRAEYSYPDKPDGSGVQRLFDYYGMLIHLRNVELDAPGDEITLQVATSGGPQAYRILVSEARSSERTFTDLALQEKVTLPVEEFRLTVSPASPGAEEGFLKMEGEVEIWVEAETKTLLEIHGKVPKIPGKVKLVLSAMG